MSYDKFPSVYGGPRDECQVGWDAIAATLRQMGRRIVAVEAYPGVDAKHLETLVRALGPDLAIDAADALKPERTIEQMVFPDVTDDPVFGKLTHLRIDDFFSPEAIHRLRTRIADERGTIVVYGTGATLIAPGADLLVYADMTRWETQSRMRRDEFANLGSRNETTRWQERYKRAYFVDWRVADRLKRSLWDRMDFVLDTVDPLEPKMIPARAMLRALHEAARRPFRVVPYFDPAPWGGTWMREVCDLDPDVPNYGWCFDCVPEENSLLLSFGDVRFEIPAQNLVYREPRDLLGTSVYGRFGEEFPIRFDFLDSVGGGNLSLQVHPLTGYIQDRFGMHYTQDESYYVLDTAPGAGHVYLGVREGLDPAAMLRDLRRAERGEISFPADEYVNRFPARKHDHFLIPAGTLHCSGDTMVLEISATPYIFTFKLWDWDRPGLDGTPRPVHIDHAEQVIRWERDTAFALRELVNRITPIASGDGWREERTGLHEAEFIETRRHWFTKAAPHAAIDGVNVLNLVQGEQVVVTSPDGAFDPFEAHYAETFIVPAAAGPYSIEPAGRSAEECATIKAFVRTRP